MNFVRIGNMLVNLDNVALVNLDYTAYVYDKEKGSDVSVPHSVRVVFNVFCAEDGMYDAVFTGNEAPAARATIQTVGDIYTAI